MRENFFAEIARSRPNLNLLLRSRVWDACHGTWGASKRVIRRASRCKVHLWISLLALLYRADVGLAALGHHTISRNQHAVRTMVINSVVDLTAGDSSDDALSYELSNHILKMKSCLRAKGFLQTLPPSLCSRPASKYTKNTV